MTKTKNDVLEMKQFLASKHADKVKVLAKIETKEALRNFKDILDVSDGVILMFDKIEKLLKEMKLTDEMLIQLCKKAGKPVIVTFVGKSDGKSYTLLNETQIKKFCSRGADAYMIDTMLQEDDPLEVISQLTASLELYRQD